MTKKILLKEISSEPWSYTIYRSDEGMLLGDFCYSPKSYVDFSMLIVLNDNELKALKKSSGFYSRMAEDVRNNYEAYIHRALDRKAFRFK